MLMIEHDYQNKIFVKAKNDVNKLCLLALKNKICNSREATSKIITMLLRIKKMENELLLNWLNEIG